MLRQSFRQLGRQLPRPASILLHNTRAASRLATSDDQGRAVRTTKGESTTAPIGPGQTDPTITHHDPAQYPTSNPIRHQKPTLQSFSLEGKTAIITGGARGLGYAMTQALLESGANIAILDLNGSEAQTAAEKLRSLYRETNPDAPEPRITAHETDVASPDKVSSTFSEVLKSHSAVDILVTSAGFCENIAAEQYPFDKMQKLWDVNVNGTYLIAAEMARWVMREKRRASMVFIGSMSGAIVNVPQAQAPYNASKAAVRQMCASMAVEWAQKGIRVNTISPGYMKTALTEKILDERPDLREKWTGLTPMGELGKPEDLMGAVVFLASDAARYITGAELRVDGGYTCI